MVIREGPEHQAMTKFRDLAVNVWTSLGKMPDPGMNVTQWLQKAGLHNVVEELQTLKIGAAASDQEQGEDALYLCLNMFDAIQRIVSGKSTIFIYPLLHSTAVLFLYLKICD